MTNCLFEECSKNKPRLINPDLFVNKQYLNKENQALKHGSVKKFALCRRTSKTVFYLSSCITVISPSFCQTSNSFRQKRMHCSTCLFVCVLTAPFKAQNLVHKMLVLKDFAMFRFA